MKTSGRPEIFDGIVDAFRTTGPLHDTLFVEHWIILVACEERGPLP
jgi:hypothetical protein